MFLNTTMQAAANHDNSVSLSLKNVWASYGKKEILRGLTLDVRRGEIVALIGANGAGKSTLLKTAMGILAPREGTIEFEGRNMKGVPVHRRSALGLCYGMQNGPVFPSLSVRENMSVAVSSVPQRQRSRAIETALELFPLLRERLEVRGGLLSGGQRQALSLAMTFAQNPKVLLLDEPSAGLSPKIAGEVLTAVKAWNKRTGGAVLLVEQRVKEARQLADRVVVLENGSVLAETSKIVNDMRAGHALSPTVARDAVTFPTLDYLRRELTPDDLSAVFRLCESSDSSIQYLGLALLQPFQDQYEVKGYLEELWQRPGLAFETRFGVQYRLLDFDLNERLQSELMKFTCDNWEMWLDRAMRDAGSSSAVLRACRNRLESPDFHAGKKWVYICMLAASNDKEEASRLALTFCDDADPIRRQAAERVLEHIGRHCVIQNA